MARHSHWANIQVTKGKTDKKRAGVFSKLAKNITVIAKEGGGDPSFNFKLRMAVEAAKAVNMPKDNIERAIERGVGGAAGEALETVVYEAMGPGGAALLVEAITDNRNRTNGNLRALMSKIGLNPEAKVMWLFERKGVVRGNWELGNGNWEDIELALIDAGASDIRKEESAVELIGSIADLQRLTEAAKTAGLSVDSAAIEYLAKDMMTISDEDSAKIDDAIETLEDDDDVNVVYANV